MPSDKIVPVGGAFNWEAGMGYQRPSPKPGGGPMVVPPDWNAAPHETNPAILEEPFPAGQPGSGNVFERVPGPDPRQPAPDIGPEFALVNLEYIDLSVAEARFMGHNVKLDEDSMAAIKMILGQAICENLRREQQRVLDSVQDGPLPPRGGRRAQDVCPLPSPESPVERGEPSRGEVPGVRQQDTAPGAKDVRPLPRKKARPPRARAARRRVPGQDDSSVPPA